MANQISPMAYVHPDAKLGDNNIIGPFCYIDADVVIGDNNKMQNSVTLNQGTRMGQTMRYSLVRASLQNLRISNIEARLQSVRLVTTIPFVSV